jgi:prepilin-type N-terminal cleavage/methylation domain-containing protein
MSTYWQRGFTLFELLVTISIIGILIALGTVSFTTAQQNGRDARRRSDVAAVQNALEQFYAVNAAYPTTCNAGLVTSVLPQGYPTDPKTGLGYTMTCSDTAYCICATLERTDQGNASAADCTFGTGNFYCATSVQ